MSSGTLASRPASYGNLDLTWEKTSQFNAGVNVGFYELPPNHRRNVLPGLVMEVNF